MNEPVDPRTSGAGAGVDLARVWTGVAAEVWRREAGPVERTAARLLRSPGLARALVTTPSLLIGWLIATAAVVVAGMAATLTTGTPWVPLLAPALAGAGIAYAYGPGIDPAWELAASMAVSDRMVLLARALAVFALNALLGLAASATCAPVAAMTFGWLLPMAAVSALALSAATVSRSANIGVGAALAGWALVVLGGRAATGSFTTVIATTPLVVPYLLTAAAGAALAWYATRIPRRTV
ncbi:hypothetical protein [Actinoplanes sp. NPDC051411]|uniref:hypothetical protein n=1 Tax=Actinoplanes sp. NPDC051411 TaxID=3155522 RepID=UPI00344343D9